MGRGYWWGLLIAIASFGLARPGAAYTVYPCAGGAEVWANNQSKILKIFDVSFPSGSAERADLLDAINRWESIGGTDLDIRYQTGWDPIHGTHNLSDLTSEISFLSGVDFEEIAGDVADLGLALGVADLSCHIAVFDVIFNADESWDFGVPNQDYTVDTLRRIYKKSGDNAYSFLNTALHELGHMSLDHTALHDIMVTNQKSGGCPDPGNHPEQVGPDSRKGMRDLYPGSGSEVDVAVTTCYLDPLDEEGGHRLKNYDRHTYEGKCPGQNILVDRTLINYGTGAVTAPLSYYLSDDLEITKNDTLIQSQTISLDAESTSSATEVPLLLPNIPSAGYGKWWYLGAIIDPDTMLGEAITSNNRGLLRTRVKFLSQNECLSFQQADKTLGPEKTTASSVNTTTTVNLQAIISRSLGIYSGKIVGKEFVRIGRDELPFTLLKLSIDKTLKEENIKGRHNNTLEIRHYGGIDEERQMRYWMEGVPSLKTEQEFLFFIGQNYRHWNPFVRGEAAIWPIQRNDRGEAYVTSYFGDPVVGVNGTSFLIGQQTPISLEEVIAGLQQIIADTPNPAIEYDATEPRGQFNPVPPKGQLKTLSLREQLQRLLKSD